jgi:hypothetical protein
MRIQILTGVVIIDNGKADLSEKASILSDD